MTQKGPVKGKDRKQSKKRRMGGERQGCPRREPGLLNKKGVSGTRCKKIYWESVGEEANE